MKSLETFVNESKLIPTSSYWSEGGHQYRLTLDDEGSVIVQRKFNSSGNWGREPSGWSPETFFKNKTRKLTIDGGTNWIITVPKDVWGDFESDYNRLKQK